MKVITVLVGDVLGFPPVLNLLNAFEKLKIESVLITTRSEKELCLRYPNTKIEFLNINYESIQSPIKKLSMISYVKRKLWNIINKNYVEGDILWVVTDVTLKYLGNKILEKNYVLHLMELSQSLVYYKKIPFIKMNAKKIGNCAKAIIVPEYNRAQITKAWWDLQDLPLILPNKPYLEEEIQKNSYIDDPLSRDIINKIGRKKIILYQGIISPERPLEMFIKAIDRFNGQYAFVVMSGGKDIYKDIKSPNYYFIPFVKPPKHLQITSHAHIGILSYVPTKSTGYSELNSLYCAPNKTFEYSMFGIPMLGNNIPGLKFLFETEKNGVCFDEFTEDSIYNAINEIENNYSDLSKASKLYSESCDYINLVTKILDVVIRRMNQKNNCR